ncbi:alpha-helical pore-forming toxin family protein [Bacillus sp. RO3]|nr:alpha-helical pore-forming toxin family protein [Bacillus sp. RO3]
MKKARINKLFSFIILMLFLSYSLIPHQAFATENGTYSLGPDNFQNAMERMASNVLIMDSYSLTLLEQTPVDFTGSNFISENIKDNIRVHQEDSRMNADRWTNQLKPQMVDVNQDIVDYQSLFEVHYLNLLSAINIHDTATFEKELETLYATILENKENADKLLVNFIDLRNEIGEDMRNFNDDLNTISSIITSHESGIPLLQQQIQQHNDAIKKNKDMIVTSGLLCLSLIGCIAGGPMIATAKKNIDFANKEIQKLNKRISDSQSAISTLTTINNQIRYLNETIDTAITSLQNISNQWNTIGAKYNSLLNNIEILSPDDYSFIKEDLNIARDSWEDLKEYADKLYEGTQKVEEDLHSVAS